MGMYGGVRLGKHHPRGRGRKAEQPYNAQRHKLRRHAAPQRDHHADRADYQKATGLEALFGWLYLRDDHARINELFNLMMEDDDAT